MSNPIIAAQLYTVREFMQTPEQIAKGLEKLGAWLPAVQVSGIGQIDTTSLRSPRTGIADCVRHPCPLAQNAG